MIVAIVQVIRDYIPLIDDDGKMKTFETHQEANDYCEKHILASAYDTIFLDMEERELEMRKLL